MATFHIYDSRHGFGGGVGGIALGCIDRSFVDRRELVDLPLAHPSVLGMQPPGRGLAQDLSALRPSCTTPQALSPVQPRRRLPVGAT